MHASPFLHVLTEERLKAPGARGAVMTCVGGSVGRHRATAGRLPACPPLRASSVRSAPHRHRVNRESAPKLDSVGEPRTTLAVVPSGCAAHIRVPALRDRRCRRTARARPDPRALAGQGRSTPANGDSAGIDRYATTTNASQPCKGSYGSREPDPGRSSHARGVAQQFQAACRQSARSVKGNSVHSAPELHLRDARVHSAQPFPVRDHVRHGIPSPLTSAASAWPARQGCGSPNGRARRRVRPSQGARVGCVRG